MSKAFDIVAFSQKRPLSWSAISSFEYDPSQWYERYVLNVSAQPTREMAFGKLVGEKLASDPDFLPHVPRYREFEYELKYKMDTGLHLIGFIDSYEPKRFKGGPAVYEYKTGKKAWDQKRADDHGQITMYLMMLYFQHQLFPQDVKTHVLWLPTKSEGDFSISFVNEKDVRIFETGRTMTELIIFGKRIRQVAKAMEDYANKQLI